MAAILYQIATIPLLRTEVFDRSRNSTTLTALSRSKPLVVQVGRWSKYRRIQQVIC